MALILEAFDKACDISRDYLIAPTATGAAPAASMVPEKYREFVMALIFVIVLFAVKGIYHHHKRLKEQQETHTGRHEAS